MVIVVIAAVATWLNVVRTIRDPDPLAIPERPPIAGVVWSNRVFIHERALKRWLETRGYSYAAWARAHPRAVAVLRDRPPPRQLEAASRKPGRAAASAAVASDDIGLAALALLVAGLLGAAALVLLAARRAVAVATDRSFRVPRLDAGPLVRRSGAAWEVLARTAQRSVSAARAGTQALLERLGERWTDGLPSVHRRSPATEAAWVPIEPQPRATDVPLPVAAAPADVAPRHGIRERFADAPVADSMRRLHDMLREAFEAFSDYGFRVAVWVLTAVIAAAALTFLIAQSI